MITRIRCSALPSWNDCARRTCANGVDSGDPADEGAAHSNGSAFRQELIERGFELRDLPVNIGPSVGTAVHAGARAILEGNPAADQIAIEALRNEIRDGCEYDNVTRTSNVAEQQTLRMVEVHRTQIAPKIEPAEIECELVADIGSGFELVGHPDVITVEARNHDLKTGQRRWPAMAQLGGYDLLARARGEGFSGLQIDYIPRSPLMNRTGVPKPQAPAEKVEYDQETARRYAIATVRHIKRVVTEFREKGAPDVIPANPMSELCARKWCPAHGTKFCEVWKR